jgi:hypothetical protein
MKKLTANDILQIAQPIFDAMDEVKRLRELEKMFRKDSPDVDGMKLFDSDPFSPFVKVEEDTIPSHLKLMAMQPRTIHFANGSSITFPKEGPVIINHGYNKDSI